MKTPPPPPCPIHSSVSDINMYQICSYVTSTVAQRQRNQRQKPLGEAKTAPRCTHSHTYTYTHNFMLRYTQHKPQTKRKQRRRAARGRQSCVAQFLLLPPLPQPGAGGICQSSGRQPTNTSPVMQPNGIELQCRGRIWMPIFAEYTGSCVAKPPTAPLATSMRILPCRSFFSSYLDLVLVCRLVSPVECICMYEHVLHTRPCTSMYLDTCTVRVHNP